MARISKLAVAKHGRTSITRDKPHTKRYPCSSVENVEDISKWTIPQLQFWLKCRRLNQQGLKKDLVEKHTGVVCYGREYFYGGGGIESCLPVTNPVHQSKQQRPTHLTAVGLNGNSTSPVLPLPPPLPPPAIGLEEKEDTNRILIPTRIQMAW